MIQKIKNMNKRPKIFLWEVPETKTWYNEKHKNSNRVMTVKIDVICMVKL